MVTTNDRVAIDFTFKKEYGVNRLKMEVYPTVGCGVVGSFIFNNVTCRDIDALVKELLSIRQKIKD